MQRLRPVLFSVVLLAAVMDLHAQGGVPSLLPDSVRSRIGTRTSLLDRSSLPVPDMAAIPSPYSYQHLGIFCKAEVKMNRWFPIPVMIRMGDVEKAEELDGKGAYRSAP